jgi:hypothetical protein
MAAKKEEICHFSSESSHGDIGPREAVCEATSVDSDRGRQGQPRPLQGNPKEGKTFSIF